MKTVLNSPFSIVEDLMPVGDAIVEALVDAGWKAKDVSPKQTATNNSKPIKLLMESPSGSSFVITVENHWRCKLPFWRD